jgi:hypothetical protein
VSTWWTMEPTVDLGLRLVRTIHACPRLRALLAGVGYTARDHRLGWRLVTRAQDATTQRLLLRAFVHAWAKPALRLAHGAARVRR